MKVVCGLLQIIWDITLRFGGGSFFLGNQKRDTAVCSCVFAFCCALCTGGCFHGRKSVNTFHTPDATGNIMPPTQNKPNRHPRCLRWLIFPPVSSLSLCGTLNSKVEKKVVFCWSDSWGLVLDNSLVMAAPSAAQSNYCM